MFNAAELEQYMNRNELSDTARQFIRHTRDSEAVIDLQARQGANSFVLVHSRKMGDRHVFARSRTLLAAATRWHEFDRSVHEYYVEPVTTTFETRDEDGVLQNRAQHTFRFLVLDTQPFLEDFREESELLAHARKDAERPVKVGRFHRDPSGRWHDREAETFCATLGLEHRLRTSRNIPQLFLQNLRFLTDYLDGPATSLDAEIRERITAAISTESLTFATLVEREKLTADQLFFAIAQQVVHVDLFEDNLRDPEHLFLHRDRGQRLVFMELRDSDGDCRPLPLPAVGVLRPGTRIEYGEKQWECVLARSDEPSEALFQSRDGHQLVLPADEAERLVLEQSGESEREQLIGGLRRRTLFDLSTSAKETAIRKLEAVRSGGGGYSRSTMDRARRIVEGSSSLVDALIALAGRNADKGSRAPRLPQASEELARQTIEAEYNQPATNTSGKKAYDSYQLACIAAGTQFMSYVTFLKRLERFRNPLKRSGKRIAYRDGDIPLTLDIREPVHGLLPHEVLYCDHTQLNLATCGPQRQPWGKVWLSAGTDGHVPRARAMYLTYAAPSSVSVLMLLRDYVRRHGRLPRVIVVDGGKEFRTAAFTKFCSMFGIEIRYRGPGRPRGGTLIERMFGVTEEEFLSGLSGNTSHLKEARTTTASVQPDLFREWTFPRLYQALDRYLFRVRPEVVHPAIGMTPSAFEAFRLAQTGHRKHVAVAFDENLLLLTCPAPPQLTHKVYARRGIWESGRYYWHSDLSRMAGQKLEVRIEPWNANVLYVCTNRRWIVAVVRDVEPYRGRTRYEVEYARREERRFNRLAAARDQRSPERARRMVESQDPLNFSESIAQMQQVMGAVYANLGMTAARPLAGIVPELPAPDTHEGVNAVSDPIAERAEVASSMPRTAAEELPVELEIPDEETAYL